MASNEYIMRYVADANYISIDPDNTDIIMLHYTLRDLATERGLNHSTISKALIKGDICTCNSKTHGRIIIRRLHNSHASLQTQ